MASIRTVRPIPISRECHHALERFPRSMATDMRRILDILPAWAAEPLEAMIIAQDDEDTLHEQLWMEASGYTGEDQSALTQSGFSDDGSGGDAAAPEQPVRDAALRHWFRGIQPEPAHPDGPADEQPGSPVERPDPPVMDGGEQHEQHADGEYESGWRI